jgi:hypothetical protein
MTLEQDEQIRLLMRAALDDAFKAQIMTLYRVWVTDRVGQPERAANGAKIAIDIYKQAIKAIDKLED